jgi:hypothetical protein
MKKILAVTVVFLMLIFSVNAETTRTRVPVKEKGETVISGDSREFRVKVRIMTHEMEIGKPSDRKPEIITSNCTYSRFPCSIVDRIDIAVNGKSISVPRSVFCDLADLNNGEILMRMNEAELILEGGNASESYVTRIIFDATHVKSRSLSSGMAPKRPLQVTEYYTVTVDDE